MEIGDFHVRGCRARHGNLVAIIQGGFYAAIARRLSGEKLLVVSYGLQAIGLALMPFAPGLAVLILLSTLFGLGAGLATPTINGRASVLTPPERQGEMLGLLQSSRAFGFLFAPILGGILFDWKPKAPYLLAGGLLLVIALAVFYGQKK